LESRTRYNSQKKSQGGPPADSEREAEILAKQAMKRDLDVELLENNHHRKGLSEGHPLEDICYPGADSTPRGYNSKGLDVTLPFIHPMLASYLYRSGLRSLTSSALASQQQQQHHWPSSIDIGRLAPPDGDARLQNACTEKTNIISPLSPYLPNWYPPAVHMLNAYHMFPRLLHPTYGGGVNVTAGSSDDASDVSKGAVSISRQSPNSVNARSSLKDPTVSENASRYSPYPIPLLKNDARNQGYEYSSKSRKSPPSFDLDSPPPSAVTYNTPSPFSKYQRRRHRRVSSVTSNCDVTELESIVVTSHADASDLSHMENMISVLDHREIVPECVLKSGDY